MSSKYIAFGITLLVIIGGGAFYGGMKYQSGKTPAQFTQGQARDQGGPGGGQRGGGQFGQGRPDGGNNSGQGDFVAGDIMSKDDKSITVKTRDGGSKIIYFSDSTTIGKAVSGTSSDLATGQQVMVNGKSSSDGSFSAQNIQIRPDQINQ
ncbi:MAG: DUF5666 domain-containing protein [Candidatus Moranbacteria bacterium]|nr:DUF5666 domain-containing protein [Candidatus Moranbacteria bacterium]